jgi:alpha-N-acetylglucosamine transferase
LVTRTIIQEFFRAKLNPGLNCGISAVAAPNLRSMKAIFTYLGSDEFLPGLLVLEFSLRSHDPEVKLVVMVSKNVAHKVLDVLKYLLFDVRIVDDIVNPNRFSNDVRNFRLVYTKLHVFAMTEFEKIVYVDLDMLICDSISCLFEKPHMSAVIAGALAPGNSSWVDLNSGLLVIEPDTGLFQEMVAKIPFLPSKDGSDQGFLHSFFPNWKNNSELHLDHRFNVPCPYLNEYCSLADFDFSYCDGKLSTRNISVLHYWALPKPWQQKNVTLRGNPGKREQATLLWWDMYKQAAQKTDPIPAIADRL